MKNILIHGLGQNSKDYLCIQLGIYKSKERSYER